MLDYDVIIIGAGVTGSAIARELARYSLRTAVVEKDEDVCSGTSKANSAIVHAGFDAVPGTLKAKLNVEGNRMMEKLSEDLDFPFKRNGSMVLCFSEEEKPGLEELLERGKANGVEGLQIITGDEAREMEPALSDEVVYALHAPTGGIVCPFGLTIALAENASENGVEFLFNRQVDLVEKTEEGYVVHTSLGDLSAKYVVNAAGVYADRIHNMVSENKIQIIPRRGEYVLMDKEAGGLVSHTIFQLPGKLGKGVLVTPTVHGNLLVGPNAVDLDDKENTSTTAEGLDEIRQKALKSVKGIPYYLTITSFAGLRAHEVKDDFIIGEAEDAEGFFDAAGIESPGLSCAPALGRYAAEMIAARAGADKKADFKGTRKGFIRAAELDPEERGKLIREKPEYGNIICRCENISEGEIRDAIRRTPGAVSLDGIKRRVRQGMGRCQAGFCTPKAMNILAEELHVDIHTICKNKEGSEFLKG